MEKCKEGTRQAVYCPICHRKVGEYDGRSCMNVVVHCRKCWKRIVYHIDTGETEVKKIPPRNCGSGMTFY